MWTQYHESSTSIFWWLYNAIYIIPTHFWWYWGWSMALGLPHSQFCWLSFLQIVVPDCSSWLSCTEVIGSFAPLSAFPVECVGKVSACIQVCMSLGALDLVDFRHVDHVAGRLRCKQWRFFRDNVHREMVDLSHLAGFRSQVPEISTRCRVQWLRQALPFRHRPTTSWRSWVVILSCSWDPLMTND